MKLSSNAIPAHIQSCIDRQPALQQKPAEHGHRGPGGRC